jgi:hypothetical protein
MNEPSKKTGRYVLGGALVLCLFIILGWFAFREEPSPPDQQPAKAETVKPVAPTTEPTNEVSNEVPTNQLNDSATTNAADLYRQAFALYNALTNDEKDILRDWQTNVDAAVETALCEKIRPICDLMHQASAVTNCDWGFEPLSVDTTMTVLKPLNSARNIARTAIWSAAHCRSNDMSGAADDTMSVLHLGQQFSQTGMIGSLVDMALQGLASSYVAANLGRFQGSDAQRLAAAFSDPTYEQAPSLAMAEEADMQERFVEELETKQASEVEKQFSDSAQFFGGLPTNLNQAAILVGFKQIADSERELANILAFSSEDEYEAWQKEVTELQSSSPFAGFALEADEAFVDKVRRYEVDRALVVAGFAIAQSGVNALQSILDPSSGQPFVYTETADGFRLQSTYQVDGKPMTMQFK